jgi:hypothetical protein
MATHLRYHLNHHFLNRSLWGSQSLLMNRKQIADRFHWCWWGVP